MRTEDWYPYGEKELLEQMKRLAAAYTPEWRMDTERPDVGTALAMIYADMFEGTVRRFNRLPEKNRSAFFQEVGTELQKLKRSLLGAYLQSSAELNIMRQVLTEMVGSAQEQQSTLKMQAAKFNYYAQILGRDFTVIANAQRTAESDRSLVATNLGAYEQNMPVQFILGSMLLSAYNLYFKVIKNTLFDAYEKLHLALPL